MCFSLKKDNQKAEQKRNLLIYAHYYYPDVASTGQILKELAEGMEEQFHIIVICTVPSYCGVISSEYKKKVYYKENINHIDLIRVKVSEFSKDNKLSRIRNIIDYFFRALIATFKVGRVDYIYTISQPPILGGVLGVIGKWIKHAKLIYNIQDFNPEQIIAVNYSGNKILLKLMQQIDKFSCSNADRIILVGRDMVDTLKNRFRKGRIPNYCLINNWIDENEIYPLEDKNEKVSLFRKTYGMENKFVIMYSGNLGLYYDLENLMQVIHKFEKESDVIFAFIGSGSVREKMISYKETNNLDNVVFIPYQNKEDLIYALNAGDVHWVMNAKGIKGVSVPSKLYGVMAAGKPVLGVLEEGSEARIILEESECGFVVEPKDYDGIEAMIRDVIRINRNQGSSEDGILKEKGKKGRAYLMNYLKKDISIKKYMEVISNC